MRVGVEQVLLLGRDEHRLARGRGAVVAAGADPAELEATGTPVAVAVAFHRR